MPGRAVLAAKRPTKRQVICGLVARFRAANRLTKPAIGSLHRWSRERKNFGVVEEAAHDSDLAERKRSSFLAYSDESGRVIDFHALRHNVHHEPCPRGVHPKTAQSLARHSTITLTMGPYTHSVVSDLATALDSLPPVASPEPRVEKLRATGTEGGRSRCAVSPVWNAPVFCTKGYESRG